MSRSRYTLLINWLTDWLIDWLKKIRDNFQVCISRTCASGVSYYNSSSCWCKIIITTSDLFFIFFAILISILITKKPSSLEMTFENIPNNPSRIGLDWLHLIHIFENQITFFLFLRDSEFPESKISIQKVFLSLKNY